MKPSTPKSELPPSTQLRKAVLGVTHQIILLLGLLLGPELVLAQGNVLLNTINNPSPANSDTFGGAVAAMGIDRVIIGAEGAGEAYLFSLAGTLMTTFTNPPGAGGFAATVAAVGSDRVLIGAYGYVVGLTQVGAAYLFNTNGALVTTFTNPSPATMEAFGWSVAEAGSDRVFIGTVGGAAYLFRTNGTLLTTFTNPAAASAGFGSSLAAVGSDRVLIGAPYNNTGAAGAGTAYLFSTNGALLNTFTNPIPTTGDNFGTSVTAVGSDRVLISAIDYDGSKGTGGAAYLFSTTGTLLTTFTKPTPATYDYFGWSVAAVGSSRVLISAYQDGASAFQAGSAYLFGTNGMLLTTFVNPTPASQDWFGWSVAAVGSDQVIFGGVWDNTGATDSGSAYLFALPYPPLTIAGSASTVSVKWVTAETGLILQQTDQLGMPTVWSDTTNSVSINGLTNVIQETMVATNRFYRLRRL
jgi:hypothetical protein